MKINVKSKVTNSTFFASLLEFRPDLKNVPFPSQYHNTYSHYKNYISDGHQCTLQDYGQYKRQFELCHYLDDKQYLEYCLLEYLKYMYSVNNIIIDDKQSKQIIKNKLKQLFDCIIHDHQKFMQTLHIDLQRDIQSISPYFLLPKDVNSTFFDTWLHLNHSKTYVLCDNVITYRHISKLETLQGKSVLKLFKTGYTCNLLHIEFQQHGILCDWINWDNTKVIGYYNFGIKCGLQSTWCNQLFCDEVEYANGIVKQHKSWHSNGQLKCCVNFHNNPDRGLLEMWHETGLVCDKSYIDYSYYLDIIQLVFT